MRGWSCCSKSLATLGKQTDLFFLYNQKYKGLIKGEVLLWNLARGELLSSQRRAPGFGANFHGGQTVSLHCLESLERLPHEFILWKKKGKNIILSVTTPAKLLVSPPQFVQFSPITFGNYSFFPFKLVGHSTGSLSAYLFPELHLAFYQILAKLGKQL